MKKLNKISELINDIHQNIGTRIAGSREEKLAARQIKSILSQYSDESDIETFKCNSRTGQHDTNLICIMYSLALLGYLVYPRSVLFIIFITAVYVILSIFYDIRLIDLLFSDDKSQNVIAKIRPKAESKEKIIFSAHIDSPYVNNIYGNQLNKYAFYINKILIACFASLLFISLLREFDILAFIMDYLYLIPFLGLGVILFFQNKVVTYDKSVGANNNLSGLAVTTALAKYFFENKPENVEINICNFGAKEANLKGSKCFLEKHFNEIKDVKLINIDSIAGGTLFVIEKENYVNHSLELSKILLEAAENISVPLYKTKTKITTEAKTFSSEKISAISLLSLDKNGIPLRYCLKEDLPAYISEEDLQNTYKICIEVVKLLDERTKK